MVVGALIRVEGGWATRSGLVIWGVWFVKLQQFSCTGIHSIITSRQDASLRHEEHELSRTSLWFLLGGGL